METFGMSYKLAPAGGSKDTFGTSYKLAQAGGQRIPSARVTNSRQHQLCWKLKARVTNSRKRGVKGYLRHELQTRASISFVGSSRHELQTRASGGSKDTFGTSCKLAPASETRSSNWLWQKMNGLYGKVYGGASYLKQST